MEVFNSMSKEKSPLPTGENLFQQPYTCDETQYII
jgi:hypothetical protein